MSDMDLLIEVERLRKSFALRRGVRELVRRAAPPRLVALDDVSLSVRAHRTLGIVGESGSGKSTLAKAIVRLVEPERGAIRFRGTDVLGADRRQLKELRRRVQMVYQDPYASLNPRLQVGEAIMEAARVHKLVSRKDEGRRLSELLDQVGLSPKLAERRPRALSGGQRQRVAIARALATEPDVLIADEAVSALDVSIQAQILNLFAELQRELGLTMVFISHQLSVVGHIADDVAVMYLGRVVERGPTAAVFAQPAHPYTAALLAAQPGRDRAARQLPVVKGEIPSLLEIPAGCRFRTRCPLAEPVCAEIDPPRIDVGPEHGSWCHVMPRAARGAGHASGVKPDTVS